MKKQNNTALVLTRFLDPVVYISLFLVLTCIKSGFTLGESIRYIGIVTATVGFPAACVMFLALNRKWVSDWDITDRHERIRIFLLFFVLILPGFVVSIGYGSIFVVQASGLFLSWFIGHIIVTLFWKQSGHTGTAMLVSGMSMIWFGLPAALLLPTIILVAWTRVVLKKHTVAQVIGGTVYSIIVLLSARLFGMV